VSDWTYGYVADLDYTFGYYAELNPLRAALPFLNASLAPPRITAACELGFGQGVSANIHAAASGTDWYGTDFNPSQAAFAQAMAAASGSGVRLFDQSFAEFCGRADLPDFDYIALHGIWSWVSDENRRTIVDFLRRKLTVGGVLYISYNTLPGWASMVPMRNLMTEHAEVMAAPGRGTIARIDAALDFAERLCALNPIFTQTHPGIAERLRRMKEQNRHYLAHEYFNRDWEPISFSEMADWLGPAKLTFACSANYLDHIEVLNLTAPQRAFLAEIPDPMFRQSVRDLIVNQQFRRDYWVKGAPRLSAFEQTELLRRQRVVMTTPRAEFTPSIVGVLGQAEIAANLVEPMLAALGEHKPMSIADIEAAVSGQGISLAQIFENVMALIGKGDLAPVQHDEAQSRAKVCTDRLNRFLMDRARGSGELSTLASPVTGGGFPVHRFHQLFLIARSRGGKAPADWAEGAWQILAPMGQLLLKDGKPLQTPEENRAELLAQANDFAEKRLSVLQALQIAWWVGGRCADEDCLAGNRHRAAAE
jgi:SAM-dependent methyltransferase